MYLFPAAEVILSQTGKLKCPSWVKKIRKAQKRGETWLFCEESLNQDFGAGTQNWESPCNHRGAGSCHQEPSVVLRG